MQLLPTLIIKMTYTMKFDYSGASCHLQVSLYAINESHKIILAQPKKNFLLCCHSIIQSQQNSSNKFINARQICYPIQMAKLHQKAMICYIFDTYECN